MTRKKFHDKIHPFLERELDEFRKDGDRAVGDALTVCLLKELDFRLCIDWSSRDEFWLDEVDPQWFIGKTYELIDDWDRVAEMLCADDSGSEAYNDFMQTIRREWEDGKEGEDDGKKGK